MGKQELALKLEEDAAEQELQRLKTELVLEEPPSESFDEVDPAEEAMVS